ncbi:alpha/beta hydrolase [Nocardioides sp. W3-2-3]|uniref:alpha/beta fold hydrolase n=1 Tax=Nocardioides convexus TaxID=2712224 RepID=UPI0024187525|nr:alpha/beta fold hydrolase [Nocardioides convexus]NHA01983.1 alpha/beta hydrolase [Nocardioides convexus]
MATRAALASEQVGQCFVESRRGRDRLEFTEYGAGEAWVVLVPPLLVPRSVHDHAARTLAAAGLHVLVLDPLGHGGSDRPADPLSYSVPAFAEQVVALLDHVGASRAVVGGRLAGRQRRSRGRRARAGPGGRAAARRPGARQRARGAGWPSSVR